MSEASETTHGFWRPDHLARVLGARRADLGEWAGREPAGVCTDTRAIDARAMFVAMRGARHDAHEHLDKAVTAGCPALLIDREAAITAKVRDACTGATAVLVVDDTGRALLRLAREYRRTLVRTRVIAVGGSNGKTTTVRLLGAVLSRGLRGGASARSFNNAVGVPLTILAAKPGDDYLVCEVGTNAPGEVALLADVVQPDIAVLTSLGREHLEGLHSLEGVAREEASLLVGLKRGGTAVVTADAPLLVEHARGIIASRGGGRTLTLFGVAPAAQTRVVNVRQTFDGLRFTIASVGEFSLALPGAHNACNAAAAATVGRLMGLSAGEIRAGLEQAAGAEMRLERRVIGATRILNDAYNANPESMLAAIETFGEIAAATAGVGRRVLVLGDMLELGEHGAALHEEIAGVIAEKSGADLVVCVGALMERAAARLRAAGFARVENVPDLEQGRDAKVAELLRDGDLVLLKGSRGMRLERVVQALAHRCAGAGAAP